jgi:hypothetical protein
MSPRRFTHTASALVRQILKQSIDLAPTDSQPASRNYFSTGGSQLELYEREEKLGQVYRASARGFTGTL